MITPHVITNKSEGEILTNQFLNQLKEVKDFLKEDQTQEYSPEKKMNSPQANES